VRGGKTEAVKFSPSQFDYGQNEFASRVPQDLGYAGFRIHYPIKTPSYQDEVIVFLGATYFRAVGRDQGFGLSARGLAIDTAQPEGEEFPWFREFWLVQPTRASKEITLYALLDSESLTGAYRFVVRPGVETAVDVDLSLFRRREVKKLGIAPLTSMFLRGEDGLAEPTDYRPEVHDSDGLLVAAGNGEWIWRPLSNPRNLTATSFNLTDPRGFGLMQRDRNFDHYQDLEARPDLRPSAWIATRGSWHDGRVELVEIPTHRDTNDNVVTYWVPSQLPPLQEPISYSYTMSWYGDDASRPPGGHVTATRHDRGTQDNVDRFLVDFEGGALASLPKDTVLRGVVSAGGREDGAEILEQQVIQNSITGAWRLVFQIRHPASQPVELRAFLQRNDEALSETWAFLLKP
jgi:glucans biosynthesis protein